MMRRNIEATVLVGDVLGGSTPPGRRPCRRHTADRHNRRHGAPGPHSDPALGWTIVILSAIPEIRLTGLILLSVGAFTGMALFWAFCTPLLTLEQRLASIALISTVGILGSATSPTIVGFLRHLTHSFSWGLWYAVGLLLLGIVTILFVSRIGRKHVSAR